MTIVFLQHYSDLGSEWNLGIYGVWLFFALSGFLIVRILRDDRREIEAGRTTPLKALGLFAWRRALRIWPIYYLVLVLFTGLSALHLVRDFPLSDAWWHYAWLSNVYYGEVLGEWTGRFGFLWSLAIEQQFYLFAAPVLLLAPSAWAKPICLLVILAAIGQNAVLWFTGATPIAIYCDALVNVAVMAVGGFAGLSMTGRPGDGRSWWLAALGLAGMAATCASVLVVGDRARPFWAVWGMAPLLLAALFASLAMVSIYRNQGSLLVRALEWRPIAWFGKVSYGFYLYHNLPPHWMLTGYGRRLGFDITTTQWVEALINFGVALALAGLSWALIEKPLLRFKDRPHLLGRLFSLQKAERPATAEA